MKVFIHGFYGAGNAGDDAILHSIIDRLKQINPNIDIAVSIRSKNIQAYFGEESIDYVLGTDIAGVSRIIKESSLVIVGGGGLFQDYNSFEPENLFLRQKGAINYYSYPIIVAKMLNIKVMLYAVGIGPLTSSQSQTAMKWIADNVDEITVRDQQSYNLLQKLGVTHQVLSADPVIKLESVQVKLPKNLAKSPGLKVGLNLRNWSYASEKLKKLEHQLIPLLNNLATVYPIHYYIFPFNNLPSEVEKAKQLAMQLTGKVDIIPYTVSPKEYKYYFKQMDLLVAMRLHASIFAIYEGVPSIGISYDDKVSLFYEEHELENYCFSLYGENFRELHQLLLDCIKRPDYHKSMLKDKLALLLKREEENKRVLMRALENGVKNDE
ncbi:MULTISPECIES: polysaccharide pyruvyl transferase family protein [unclassified Sutcliffiella]|uniref:polysaccharide pyruvyl transferase family protein n=1 Tax=unclassified Sutcliffiella TaxID=2837532 RepID=UPI0030CC7F2F